MADQTVECCGNCKFFKHGKEGANGICRENPGFGVATPVQRVNPVTQQIEILKSPDNGQPIFHTFSFQMPKHESEWCGKHDWPEGIAMRIDERLQAPPEGVA